MATESFIPLRITQTIGLTTTAVLAGTNLSLSFYLIPRILESPTPLLLRQWRAAYESGKSTIAPLAALCSVTFFYLSYHAHQTPLLSHRWMGYAAAGACAIGIAPWTWAVMVPTNNKLLRKAEEAAVLGKTDEIVEIGLGGETAHALVDKWGMLNLGRGMLLSVAAVVGTWTTLL
jgi:hypothetical protein